MATCGLDETIFSITSRECFLTLLWDLTGVDLAVLCLGVGDKWNEFIFHENLLQISVF